MVMPYTLCRVLEFIHNTAAKMEEEKKTSDHKLPFVCAQFMSEPHALELWFTDKREYSLPTKDSLTSLYNGVVDKITIGWKPTTVDQHPTILHRPKASEDWLLFVKHAGVEEDVFIRTVGFHFELYSKHMECSNYHAGLGPTPALTYLWIPKDDLQRVVSAYGFKLNGTPTDSR